MDRRGFLSGAISGSAALAAAQSEQQRGELIVAQYVILELMGYKRLCGRMTQGVAGMLQLDVPVEGGVVTKYINPKSVYAITVIDADTCRAYAKNVDPLPAIELDVTPAQRRIGWQENDDDFDDGREPY